LRGYILYLQVLTVANPFYHPELHIMKRLQLLPVLAIFLFCACSQPNTGILKTTNLSSSFITIDPVKDNTLKTPKGAVIKIAANSFDVPAGSQVLIEIKEAYSMQDILMGGLVTENNGQPLISGGMIYIDAKANAQRINLIKPVKISIPTDVYDDKMKLFKGEVKDDSTLNWIDPLPLDTPRIALQIELGKALFKANCASCHSPVNDMTGPALAGCRDRGTGPDWAYRFTNNSNLMIETDPYAKYLFKKYGSRMTQFYLPYRDLKAIFDYCDNEAGLIKQYSLPQQPEAIGNFKNPCGQDTIYSSKPDPIIQIANIDSNLELATLDSETRQNDFVKAERMEFLRKGFTDPNPTTGKYDFSIKTLGWYNIDHGIEGYEGTIFASVNVSLKMNEQIDMHVYLFYPDKKMLSVGMPAGENLYHFDKINGKIPLYLNSNVVILAFGSKADRLYYGTASFAVNEEQNVSVEIKQTTQSTFMDFIKKNNIEGIQIDINKKEDFKIYNTPCDSGRLSSPDPLLSK